MASGIEKHSSVAKRSGHRVGIEVLRFNSENQREAYGFEPEREEEIVSLIHDQVAAVGFVNAIANITESEKELIATNLGDPTNKYSMAWLVNSVAKHGVQEAVRGYWLQNDEVLVITEGNRRATAVFVARLLGFAGDELAAVKVDLEDRRASELDFLIRQYVSNSGKNLSKTEEAKLFKKIGQLAQLDESGIAEVLGVPVQLIRNGLDLASALPTVHQHVDNGSVAAGAVTKLVREARNNGAGQTDVAAVVEEAVHEASQNGTNYVTADDLTKKAVEKGVVGQPKEQDGERERLLEEIASMLDTAAGKEVPIKDLRAFHRKVSKFLR